MDNNDLSQPDDAKQPGKIIRLNKPAASPSPNPPKPSKIAFDRKELSEILRVYGYRVAQGEWRDYALDFQKERAVFSIFNRAHEVPVYQVEKNPKFARKQGAYSVTNGMGMVLKRGHELRQVLKVLEPRKHLRVID